METRLTTDQKIPGSTPGRLVPFLVFFLFFFQKLNMKKNTSTHEHEKTHEETTNKHVTWRCGIETLSFFASDKRGDKGREKRERVSTKGGVVNQRGGWETSVEGSDPLCVEGGAEHVEDLDAGLLEGL